MPDVSTWQAPLAIVVVGMLLSIGWQIGALIYGAVLGLIRRLAAPGG